jgi:hypothetical protein
MIGWEEHPGEFYLGDCPPVPGGAIAVMPLRRASVLPQALVQLFRKPSSFGRSLAKWSAYLARGLREGPEHNEALISVGIAARLDGDALSLRLRPA